MIRCPARRSKAFARRGPTPVSVVISAKTGLRTSGLTKVCHRRMTRGNDSLAHPAYILPSSEEWKHEPRRLRPPPQKTALAELAPGHAGGRPAAGRLCRCPSGEHG